MTVVFKYTKIYIYIPNTLLKLFKSFGGSSLFFYKIALCVTNYTQHTRENYELLKCTIYFQPSKMHYG